MAHSDPSDPRALARDEAYAVAALEITAVLQGEPDLIARMATVTSMLAERFAHYFWTGFYCVDAQKMDELVIGPYQGSLGCLRIAFSRGVCGAAAMRRETIIVPDVEAFAGHIACDPRSRSEIVVPVFDASARLIAVLDIDAVEPAAFNASDARGLEAIVRQVFAA